MEHLKIKRSVDMEQIRYPEALVSKSYEEKYQRATLDLSRMPCSIYYPNIDAVPNEQYALIRKDGLGGSDSSIILGVNPYTTLNQLIEEKCRTELTEEELAVGQELAVRKGNDLEPLIMRKAAAALQKQVVKPVDMYIHNEYPYLRMNFDGIVNDPEQYIPCEIKVCTTRGEKHYSFYKAMYTEEEGWGVEPEHFEQSNNSVITKAAQYGVPPYYYTQCQQEIMFADAPYGYIAVLAEKAWRLRIFKIWRDEKCINDIIVQGGLTWNKIELRRQQKSTPTI